MRFAVMDTGTGIASEIQTKSFAFYVLADGMVALHFGGSGLGVSISRSLACLLDGDISVLSKLGKDSTFTLVIFDAEPTEWRPENSGMSDKGGVVEH